MGILEGGNEQSVKCRAESAIWYVVYFAGKVEILERGSDGPNGSPSIWYNVKARTAGCFVMRHLYNIVGFVLSGVA